MTSRLPASPLYSRLRSVHARVRRALVLRHALRASAAACVLLAFAVTAGLVLPRAPGTAWVRLGAFLAGTLVALGFAMRGVLRDVPRWDAWLEALETRFQGLRSWLRNALDLEARSDANTSRELAQALHGEAVARLDATPLAGTVPPLAARAPLTATSAALLSLVAVLLVAPGAARDSWQTLWAPASAAPAVALVVEPGDVTVVPGASFSVRARVTGTAALPRLAGNGPAPLAQLESAADGQRRWRFDLPPVTRARDYAVRVAGLTSPRYHIALAGEPRPVSFASTIAAPAYARLPLQAVSGTRGDLAALAGSRASVEVTFDRDLESLTAAVNGGRAVSFSELTPRRWRGEVAIAGDGAWELEARAATGSGRFRYKLSAIPDAPPVITVALPTGDLDLPAGQMVPYDLLAEDDLGVSELRLEWRKSATDPWHEQSLATFRDEPREARATARWDASALALLPGESGVMRFVALDNARIGARGRAVSGEFRVRFPSLNDLYASLEQRQDNVGHALEKAAEQAKELQKSLDKLERQPRAPTESAQSQSFERSEEMKRAAERQQQVAQQVEDAAKQMQESLEQAAERQAFQEQLQRKLQEMTALLKDIQSQELKDALKRMQDALQQMDRRAMEEALPQLQQQNKDMLQQLERSLELLKQLRQEERMDALARRADELKAKQDELNRQYGEHADDQKTPPAGSPQDSQAKSDPSSQGEDKPLPERQQKAAEESRDLAKSARDAAHEAEAEEPKQQLQQAANEMEQNAAEQQESAGQKSQQGDPQGAQSAGKKASDSLQRAADAMRQSSQQAQNEQDQKNLAAVRRASQDLVALSRSAQENLDSHVPTPQAAEAQTDLSEGVARVTDSLMAISRQTPFLSNKVTAALGRAMQGLSQSGREMSQGGRERGESSARGASSSLNEAVKELRSAESSMCQKPGNGKGGRTSSERLGQIGEQQSQLNRRSRLVARRLSQQIAQAQGDPAELRRLAEEQQRIRQQLEEVRRDEEAKKSLLGRLDQAQKDMQQVEEALRDGRVGDELEQQQTQILSRLLDAQRSIHRRDFDPEREARRGEDVARQSPAPLAQDLFRENDRLRQDLLKADADRVPPRYRTLIEAYLRALNAAPAAPSAPAPPATPPPGNLR